MVLKMNPTVLKYGFEGNDYVAKFRINTNADAKYFNRLWQSAI
jgi:hypothetical protein